MSSIAGSLECMMVAVNGQREIGMTEKKKRYARPKTMPKLRAVILVDVL